MTALRSLLFNIVFYLNLILFLTFTTVIGTLVVQGLTLPPLIRMLKLPGRDAQAETLAEAPSRAASRAGAP